MALVVLALAITPSFAGTQPIRVYGTGTVDNVTHLPNAVVDPHYVLATGYGGVVTGPAYTEIGVYFVPPPPFDWIAPYTTLRESPIGNYDYQTTFWLPSFVPGSAELTGSWAADNCGEVYLNGPSTGVSIACDRGFTALHPFTITSGFQPGLNTLDFVVYNEGFITGLVVDINGTYTPTTPEPGTLALLGSGILGFGGLLRRRLLA